MLGALETEILPLGAYATLPFWPLLGAILAGIMIVLKLPAGKAHWPVWLGVGVSTLLAVMLFFDIGGANNWKPADGAHHSTEHTSAEHTSTAGPEYVPVAQDTHETHAPAHAADHEEQHTAFADHGVTVHLYNWISLGAVRSLQQDHWLAVNFYFDGLTGMMMLFVTLVSLMVVIYANGYMRDHHGHPERGYERFFAFLGLFVFSMSVLVLAGNFVLLYLGWELVGLCSYLLIGFYYSKPSAAAAAKKAFIVNRIGDFGFALGIFALYMFISPLVQPGENSLDYAVVFKYATQLEQWQLTTCALLLLCGAIGKSAQFPLYVWLPDAMEGPTPVSALIHAATMVTAGIYLIARCGPIFAESPLACDVVMWVGVIGAFLAASMAMAQYDMKRILAYSTISQLAFMFVALGALAPASAVFHVFTHAWFKALLFLCAGSVMHAMGNVIDVRQFSGLRRVLPQTHWLMLIGCIALAGLPPFAGFWSKDEIVHASYFRSPAVGVIMMIVAGMTAYYTFRMYFLAFHGRERWPAEAGEHPHESPPVMLRPLYVLAAGAIAAGVIGFTISPGAESVFGVFKPNTGVLHDYLSNSSMVAGPHHAGGLWIAYASIAIAAGGVALAWLRYGAAPEADPDARALGKAWEILHAKYYVDELYDRVFVRPLRGIGRLCNRTDDTLVNGAVLFVGSSPRFGGWIFSFLQRGALQTYALTMLIGLAILLAIWGWQSVADVVGWGGQ